MDTPQSYIIIALIVIIGILFFYRRKKAKKLSQLAALSFGCILAGILFNDTVAISYGLLGIGVILAIVDIFRKKRK
ncbi:hypothetical protein KKH82_08720 [Patescibacteria group bacterium]|nr:hypothetical protein [Patescibacteria group bacterium]